MIAQVRAVAILMIVHGILVSLMGAFYALMGPLMYTLLMRAPPGPGATGGSGKTEFVILSAVYVAIGLPALAVGILNIVAGIRCLRLRGRILALVALFSNIVSVFTCYCLPTSVGLMIYGLIVFFHSEVAFAFAEVAAGAPPERFEYYRRPPDEDDFEDEPLPSPAPKPRQSNNVQLRPNEDYRRPPDEE